MSNTLFGIDNLDSYLVLGILFVFALIEARLGYLKNSKRTFSDWIQEAGGFAVLSIFTKPGIVLAVLGIGNRLFPQLGDTLAGASLWWALPLFMLVDDFFQYWYHRSAHEYDWLWKLHRPHHQAEEMGFFVSYRNAALYYVLMPNIWWIAVFTLLGGGMAVAIGLVLKQLIIIGSHSTTRWDRVLYKYRIFDPVASVVERIIVTPAFHFAHHGKSMADGISDPNGNYGNMFSIWDQVFGTAKFTRKYPSELGLVNDPKEEWAATMLYPFIKSKKRESEISKGFEKVDTRSAGPAKVELNAGQKYLWCRCGKSQNQPFCDGTHHGSKFKPLLFEVQRDKTVQLCNCKLTKAGPFCDNSHAHFEKGQSKHD